MAVESYETPDGVTRHRVTGLSKARGVIGREPAPGEAYVFPFDGIRERVVHMLGVTEPLDVEFRVVWNGRYETTKRVTLQPWTGHASAECTHIIERHASPAAADPAPEHAPEVTG
ncbi:hypothetical protein EGH24_13820 [Halonotius terrestris]|uniref:Uncharacterized protein n=1 Tax=Halonotius terrestris TaxID=2487750 RepID=A0A8J8TBK9_9EURY|nr:hypothetical protein [Halonotius terrestris]TQQ78595.1 hypothetical protein EGH24_13820 [Halonotius terrestris]